MKWSNAETMRAWHSAVKQAVGAAFVLTALAATGSASAQSGGLIDTHAHLVNGGPRGTDFRGSIEATVQRMDAHGIRATIVMPPPMVAGRPANYDLESYAAAVQAHAGRVYAAGGGGSLNVMLHAAAADAVSAETAKAFRARAEEIAAAGAVAFGEIAVHHLSLRPMGPQHPYEAVAPDHPLLMLLADVAAEKNIPIDLHMDLVPTDMSLPERPAFNPANPATLRANMAAFERLLAHNRRARIVWAHAGTDPLGTRTPQIQRELLTRNPNLFMSLRLGRGAPAPFFALAPDLTLKPQWLALLRDFPDRFVIGTDFFHSGVAGAARGPDEETLEYYRRAIGQLPPALAEAVSHANAERIYPLRCGGGTCP